MQNLHLSLMKINRQWHDKSFTLFSFEFAKQSHDMQTCAKCCTDVSALNFHKPTRTLHGWRGLSGSHKYIRSNEVADWKSRCGALD